jgi:hypothetical protein
MTESATPRLALPMLAVGQAQKEITHNEALVLIDALIAARAVEANAVTPPASPQAGQCWALGAAPTGVWQGKGGQLAIATAGGWRFCDVEDDFAVRIGNGGARWTRAGSGWIAPPALALPNGGSVIDSEARAAIAVLKSALAASGQLASN